MLTIECHSALYPKPRGRLNRSGNIWHTSPEYEKFKSVLLSRLSGAPISTIKQPFFTGLVYGLVNNKVGAEIDVCDNGIGAILDTLKTNKIIKDDNARYWQGSYIKVVPVTTPYFFFCLHLTQQTYRVINAVNIKVKEVQSNFSLYDFDYCEKNYQVIPEDYWRIKKC